MTTIAIAFRHQGEAAATVVADLDDIDAKQGVEKLINFIDQVASGCRGGYATIDLDSATFTATYPFNGAATGQTTTYTITTDEPYDTMKAELGEPTGAINSNLWASKVQGFLSGLLGGTRNGKIATSGTFTRTWLFGKA